MRCLSCVGEVGPKGVKRARVGVGRAVEPDSGSQRQRPAPSLLGAAENVGVGEEFALSDNHNLSAT